MSKHETHGEDPNVVHFVSIALEMQERGIVPPIDEICRERPDLVPAVMSTLGMAERLPSLERESARLDAHAGRELAERYRLLTRIGAGAMGTVYRAEDLKLRRHVAVKLLHAQFMSGREASARFARESEVLAAVQHRAVVTVFDSGQTQDGLGYLVMELLDGLPLSELLEDAAELAEQMGGAERVTSTDWIRDRLGPAARLDESYLRQVTRWIAELAEGLHAAHAVGVCHRDVKPSNVFIRRDGSAVLLDFGLAARDAEATIADGDRVLGTPAYMPPEQAEPRPARAARTSASANILFDVYGLAATLYHATALIAPYVGTPSQVLAHLPRVDPTPLAVRRRGVPRDLGAILDRGMAREPSARYATSRALAEDLRAFLDHRPVAARPVRAWTRRWRAMRRSPEFRVFGAIALATVIGLSAWSWYGARAEASAREWLGVWAQVPPSMSIAPPGLRAIADSDDRAVVAKKLDRLVELAVDPIPSRVVRGLFRFDHADLHGAATDFEHVAARLDTPYSRALAAAYRSHADSGTAAADEPSASAAAPALEPPDASDLHNAADRYLAALHFARDAAKGRSGFVEALELLVASASDSTSGLTLGAKTLTLQCEIERATWHRGEARRDAYRQIYEDAIRLETSLGMRTAATAVAMGAALLGQDRNQDAIMILRDAVRLAPSDLSARINAGAALQRIGALDEARVQLEHALRNFPGSLGARQNLVMVAIDGGDFEAAERAVAELGSGADPRAMLRRAHLLGRVHLNRALAELRIDAVESAVAFAQRAVEQFELAIPIERRPASPEYRIAAALAGQVDRGIVVAELAQTLQSAPLQWREIHNLATLLPDELDFAATEALRDYLFALTDELAPELRVAPLSESPQSSTPSNPTLPTATPEDR